MPEMKVDGRGKKNVKYKNYCFMTTEKKEDLGYLTVCL